MKTKRIVLVLVAALVALSAVGVASAQATEQDQRPNRQHRPRPVLNFVRTTVQAISEATELAPREIVAQLADGKTLGDVITENGASVESIKAGLLDQLNERLAQAVENGRITQEQADEILANASERIDELMTHVFERLTDRELPGRRRGIGSPNEI